MKKAFTMIELVFVIVVIGILAAIVIPRIGSNRLSEAAVQLVSHIRYTQHLAMIDDKFDGSANWYRGRWQIIFRNGALTGDELAYSIYSDSPNYTGNADVGEMASDPEDPSKLLSGGSSSFNVTDSRANRKLNLGMTYGIETATMTGGCAGQTRLSFDHLGRPIEGTIHNMTQAYDNANLLTAQCRITLVDNNDENITIAVEAETGYAHIL